jgi:hypothetical protein
MLCPFWFRLRRVREGRIFRETLLRFAASRARVVSATKRSAPTSSASVIDSRSPRSRKFSDESGGAHSECRSANQGLSRPCPDRACRRLPASSRTKRGIKDSLLDIGKNPNMRDEHQIVEPRGVHYKDHARRGFPAIFSSSFREI